MEKGIRIKEIIVVEGKDDTFKIKQAVEADTIETNGSAIPEHVIEQIKHAKEKRGVIILTDPDYPGERIRHIVSQAVPGCKHAFIPKNEAIEKSGKGVGVEHASIESIKQALQMVQEEAPESVEEIAWADLVAVGLVGQANSKELREKVSAVLKLGFPNGKQLHKRLKMFNISRQEFLDVIRKIDEEKGAE